jgi:hypothetical protein
MTVVKRAALLQTGPWACLRSMSSWLDKRALSSYTQDTHQWSAKQHVLRNLKTLGPQ